MRVCRAFGFAMVLLGIGAARPPTQSFVQRALWSPDGGQLLFTVFEGESWRIDRIAADGTGRRPVHAGPTGPWLDWSPDGRRAVILLRGDGGSTLALLDLADGATTPLATGAADVSGPAWSPDGTRIAFAARTPGGRFRIVLLALADAALRELVAEPSSDLYGPAWSADGRQLAYYASRGSADDSVFVVAADGAGPRAVARGVFPAWSPDGRIWYDRGDTIYATRLDGGAETAVTAGFAVDISPDGRSIAFVRGSWPVGRVWTARADGSGARALY